MERRNLKSNVSKPGLALKLGGGQMNAVLLGARLILVSVFLLSGVTKLADRHAFKRSLGEFGVPDQLAKPMATALPAVEMGISLSLLPSSLAWWAALAAAALLAVFAVVVLDNLIRGRKPDCHCFGALDSGPTGWGRFARNTVFLGIAGFIVLQGPTNSGPSAVSWLWTMTVPQLVATSIGVLILSILIAHTWLLVQLLRQHGRFLLRLESIENRLSPSGTSTFVDQTADQSLARRGLPIGTKVPSLQVDSVFDAAPSLDLSAGSARQIALTFIDPRCGPCDSLLPELAVWQREYAEHFRLVLVTEGPREAGQEKANRLGLKDVFVQPSHVVSQALEAFGTPSMVIVGPGGRIASHVAHGAEEIRALVSVQLREADELRLPIGGSNGTRPAYGSNVIGPNDGTGRTALKFRLRDLTGRVVELESSLGESNILLFWDPGCGFCRQMLPELRELEVRRKTDAPKLVFISMGTVEANRAMGLNSPILLAPNFDAAAAFGVGGTPCAVMVDSGGRARSEIVVGAEAVLALVRGSELSLRAAGNSAPSS